MGDIGKLRNWEHPVKPVLSSQNADGMKAGAVMFSNVSPGLSSRLAHSSQ